MGTEAQQFTTSDDEWDDEPDDEEAAGTEDEIGGSTNELNRAM